MTPKSCAQELDANHDLKLNDGYIIRAFREADWDHSQTIDWDEFLNAFAAGDCFVPEFMKPRSIRCSTLTPPWEEQQRYHKLTDTQRSQEAASLVSVLFDVVNESVQCIINDVLIDCSCSPTG